MPNRGEAMVFAKSEPKIVYDFVGLVYCFIVFDAFVLSPGLM